MKKINAVLEFKHKIVVKGDIMIATAFLISVFLILPSVSSKAQTQLDTLRMKLELVEYLDNGKFDPDRFQWEYGAGCNMTCGEITWKIEASSILEPHEKNSYGIANLEDFNHRTAWVEGVDGYGIGEYLRITFIRPSFVPEDLGRNVPFKGIYILNGYAKSEEIWKANSRIKTLKLYYNDNPVLVLLLHDSMIPQYVYWGRERMRVNDGDTVKLKIVEVYPGIKYKDTAISEITLDGAH